MTPQVLRFLLADDNDANRLISLTILERAGYSVTGAKNGAHALKLASLQPYDLIVLDIMMPVMDGMRALRQLRRVEGPNQKTPVFALTAFSTAQDRQRYLFAGFDSVLSKPLRPGDMEMAINKYIDKGAMPMSYRSASSKVGAVTITGQTQLLNKDIILELCDIGDMEILRTIQMRFWASVEEQCLVIKASLPEALRGATQHLSDFRRAVHTIKGASAAIGLSRVSEICRKLQNAPPAEISRLVRVLIGSLSQSRPALNQALSGTRQLNPAMEMRRENEAKTAHNG